MQKPKRSASTRWVADMCVSIEAEQIHSRITECVVMERPLMAQSGRSRNDRLWNDRVADLAAAAPKPTTVYEYKDQSTVFLNVYAQRNF
jgi:hypothetical protein